MYVRIVHILGRGAFGVSGGAGAAGYWGIEAPYHSGGKIIKSSRRAFWLIPNFCKVHSTLKTTPAVAAGLIDHVWRVQELLTTVATTWRDK